MAEAGALLGISRALPTNLSPGANSRSFASAGAVSSPRQPSTLWCKINVP